MSTLLMTGRSRQSITLCDGAPDSDDLGLQDVEADQPDDVAGVRGVNGEVVAEVEGDVAGLAQGSGVIAVRSVSCCE
jgi:hypothetical protein